MEIGFPNNPRKNLLEEIEWIGKTNLILHFSKAETSLKTRCPIYEISLA